MKPVSRSFNFSIEANELAFLASLFEKSRLRININFEAEDSLNSQSLLFKLKNSLKTFELPRKEKKTLKIEEDPLKFLYLYYFYDGEIKGKGYEDNFSIKYLMNQSIDIICDNKDLQEIIADELVAESKSILFSFSEASFNKLEFDTIKEKNWFKFLMKDNEVKVCHWESNQQTSNDLILSQLFDKNPYFYGKIILFGKKRNELDEVLKQINSFILRYIYLNDYILDLINPYFTEFDEKWIWVSSYKTEIVDNLVEFIKINQKTALEKAVETAGGLFKGFDVSDKNFKLIVSSSDNQMKDLKKYIKNLFKEIYVFVVVGRTQTIPQDAYLLVKKSIEELKDISNKVVGSTILHDSYLQDKSRLKLYLFSDSKSIFKESRNKINKFLNHKELEVEATNDMRLFLNQCPDFIKALKNDYNVLIDVGKQTIIIKGSSSDVSFAEDKLKSEFKKFKKFSTFKFVSNLAYRIFEKYHLEQFRLFLMNDSIKGEIHLKNDVPPFECTEIHFLCCDVSLEDVMFYLKNQQEEILKSIDSKKFSLPIEYNISRVLNDEFIQRIHSDLPVTLIYEKEKLYKEKSYQNLKNSPENERVFTIDNKCELVLCKKYLEGDWVDAVLINISLSGNILDSYSYNLAVRSALLSPVQNTLKSLIGQKGKKVFSLSSYVDCEVCSSDSKSLNFGKIFFSYILTKSDEKLVAPGNLKKFIDIMREDVGWAKILENSTDFKSIGIFLMKEEEAYTEDQIKLLTNLLKKRLKGSVLEKVYVYCNQDKDSKGYDQFQIALKELSNFKIKEQPSHVLPIENVFIIKGKEKSIQECYDEIQKEMNKNIVDECISIGISDRDVAQKLIKLISENVIYHKVLENGRKILVKDNRKEITKLKRKISYWECRTLITIPGIVYPEYFSNYENSNKHDFFFHRVGSDSKEDYIFVQDSFYRALSKALGIINLKSIMKIENYFLFNMFEHQKVIFKEEFGEPKTRYLFRGPGKYNDIKKYKGGEMEQSSSVWGAGENETLEFFETSEVPINKDSFFNQNTKTFQIFLAEVLISEKDLENSDLLFTKYNSEEKSFLIKNGFRAYPKYLIEFNRDLK